MANEMPKSDDYTGLSRKVLQYSEAFADIVVGAKTAPPGDAEWAAIERLVDVAAFEREGVFLTAEAEVLGWAGYRSYVSAYAGFAAWEGTLRHITETPGRVILELEERNTREGVMHRSNTVTIYEFSDAGLLTHLEVYVMPLQAVG